MRFQHAFESFLYVMDVSRPYIELKPCNGQLPINVETFNRETFVRESGSVDDFQQTLVFLAIAPKVLVILNLKPATLSIDE